MQLDLLPSVLGIVLHALISGVCPEEAGSDCHIPYTNSLQKWVYHEYVKIMEAFKDIDFLYKKHSQIERHESNM